MIGALLCSVTASAATYYVDSIAGSDSNSGLSTGLPWRTLAKVQSTVPASSIVLLKRGSSWTELLSISQSNVTLDAYGPATDPQPKIDSSVPSRAGLQSRPGSTNRPPYRWQR